MLLCGPDRSELPLPDPTLMLCLACLMWKPPSHRAQALLFHLPCPRWCLGLRWCRRWTLRSYPASLPVSLPVLPHPRHPRERQATPELRATPERPQTRCHRCRQGRSARHLVKAHHLEEILLLAEALEVPEALAALAALPQAHFLPAGCRRGLLQKRPQQRPPRLRNQQAPSQGSRRALQRHRPAGRTAPRSPLQ